MAAHTNTYGTKTYASDEKNIGNHKNILTKRASDTYKSVAYLPISFFFFCIAPPAFNKRSDNLSGFRGGPHFIWWTTFLVSFLWWIKTWWISSAELRNYSEVIKTLFSEHTNFRFCQLYGNKFSVANQPKWKSFVITHQA